MPISPKSDAARVAADLLLDGDWQGVEDEPLLGPQDVSPNETAAIMADVSGKPVRFEGMPMTSFGGMSASMGTSKGMVCDRAAMMTETAGMDFVARARMRTRRPRSGGGANAR